jgi:hypothetical protein
MRLGYVALCRDDDFHQDHIGSVSTLIA